MQISPSQLIKKLSALLSGLDLTKHHPNRAANYADAKGSHMVMAHLESPAISPPPQLCHCNPEETTASAWAVSPAAEALLRVLIKKVFQKTAGFQLSFSNSEDREAADQGSADQFPPPSPEHSNQGSWRNSPMERE